MNAFEKCEELSDVSRVEQLVRSEGYASLRKSLLAAKASVSAEQLLGKGDRQALDEADGALSKALQATSDCAPPEQIALCATVAADALRNSKK